MKSLYFIFLLCLILGGGCNTQWPLMEKKKPLTAGQYPQTFQGTAKVEFKYLLFLPEGYGQTPKRWPLIMFLHGLGESGDDLEQLKIHGLPKITQTQKDFPFIVVSPQCPKNKWWPEQTEDLIAFLDDVISRYDVDKDRVYLTGLSMGGFGTWSLAGTYPDRFAAIAPVCGGGVTFLACRLKDVPIWAFHGAKDPVVPVAESVDMVKAVHDCGGNAKLTIYPEAEHDSWTQTYSSKELYDWFLSYRKNPK